MGQHVRLQISRLSKPLIAVVKRTNIRPVAGVNTDVGAEVKVQGEPLATAFKRTLEEDNNNISNTVIYYMGTINQSTAYWDPRQIRELSC